MLQVRRVFPNVGRLLRILAGGWVFLFICSQVAFGYVLKNEARGTDLSIFGLGMIRFNYASVDGNVTGFEESDDGFDERFDTQEFLSLAVNGVLFRDYGLEGEVKYNQEDDPDWNFWLKLARDEHYLFFGDQSDMFSETYFTSYTSPFRGVTLHIETEKFGMTTFGAVIRGSVVPKEEIVPDGTSGPYLLEKNPVIPGSDNVTLEVRNRNDQEQIIDVIPQERNMDYTIDYDTGEITFAEPLDSENFSGNPVYILVTYRSEEESSAFNTALAGSRIAVAPTGWLELGTTYISEFDRDPSLSNGFEVRQEMYGVDGAIQLGESITLAAEYALSQDQQTIASAEETNGTETNEMAQAFQLILDGAFGEKMALYGTYHLTERNFLTFANPDVDTNEQELELVGTYALFTNHTLETGYSLLQDNIPRETEIPITTTHRPYIRWDATFGDRTEVFSKYEFIQTSDNQSPRETDKHTHTFLVGAIREFKSVPVFKQLSLRSEYQFSDFEDKTDQEADTLTHQLGIRARTEPVRDIALYVEQKERLIHDKDLKKDTERQDISEVGVEFERWERFSVTSKYQYRASHDLLLAQRTSERHTFILRSEYQPFSILKTSGKLELRDETFFDTGSVKTEENSESENVVQSDESSSQSLNLEGRLLFTPLKDFTARLRYEYQLTEDQSELEAKTREDETEFRVNYAFDRRKTRLTGIIRVERDLLEAPPTPETKTRTTTYSLSGVRQLTDRLDILAQYKREMVELSADNFREDFLGEIGTKIGRFIKFVGGYQYSNFEDKDDSGSDYTAHSYFFKIIGKL